MAKDNKKGRVVRVSKPVNRIFRQILLDLEDMGIEKTPDQLADELFENAIYAKDKELRNEKIKNL